ncbi:MAG: LysR substrate-binding domain-containing protein [Phreatobacter sp.]
MDRFAAMQSFRRVVELGSFAAAARTLGLSSPGISKHVSELEAHLKTSLMLRTTRRLSLTETGRIVYEHCCRVLDEMVDIEQAVCAVASRPRGRLKVNAPVSFGLIHLSPILPDLFRAHPELTLDLTLSDLDADPVEEGFDVAVRIRTALPDSSLIARRIGPVTRVLCAAPSYLAEAGTPRAADDLGAHRCLLYSLSDAPQSWPLKAPGAAGPAAVAVQPWFSANNSLVLRDAARAGLGICLAPRFLVADDIRAGRLVPVMTDHAVTPHQLFVVYPPRRNISVKTRVFVDFLLARFGTHPPWDGPAPDDPG